MFKRLNNTPANPTKMDMFIIWITFLILTIERVATLLS